MIALALFNCIDEEDGRASKWSLIKVLGNEAQFHYWIEGQPDERRALWIGAGFALVVQLAAFAVVRLMSSRNVIAGWGLGVILRFVSLVLFALVVAPGLGLPLAAALLSLAIYLFLTTLVEPLFLAK